jgi:hypothetical protein
LELNLDALNFHFEIVEELHAALKSIWPKKGDKFIRPEPKEALLGRLGITLPDCPLQSGQALANSES